MRKTCSKYQKDNSQGEEESDNEILSLQDENKDLFEIPINFIPIENIESFTNEYTHSTYEKTNLHDIFKNINEYIETDFTGSPEHEYESDNPIYEKHSQLIELFKNAFKGIIFSTKNSIGNINSSIALEAMKIENDNPTSESIQICGDAIYTLFQKYLSHWLPSVKELRKKITEELDLYVKCTIDDDDYLLNLEDDIFKIILLYDEIKLWNVSTIWIWSLFEKKLKLRIL